jgi:hypothetical protein
MKKTFPIYLLLAFLFMLISYVAVLLAGFVAVGTPGVFIVAIPIIVIELFFLFMSFKKDKTYFASSMVLLVDLGLIAITVGYSGLK